MSDDKIRVEFAETSCDYNHGDVVECSNKAKAVVVYVFGGIRQDEVLCLEHLGEFIDTIDSSDEGYVTDVHLLKRGRIWYTGFDPEVADEYDEKLEEALKERENSG